MGQHVTIVTGHWPLWSVRSGLCPSITKMGQDIPGRSQTVRWNGHKLDTRFRKRIRGQKCGQRRRFSLRRFGTMDSLDHVPPPAALSALSSPELEALQVELFGMEGMPNTIHQ